MVNIHWNYIYWSGHQYKKQYNGKEISMRYCAKVKNSNTQTLWLCISVIKLFPVKWISLNESTTFSILHKNGFLSLTIFVFFCKSNRSLLIISERTLRTLQTVLTRTVSKWYQFLFIVRNTSITLYSIFLFSHWHLGTNMISIGHN